MLELYNFPPSTCSLKVRLSLAEKGLEWEDRRLDSRNNDHLTPEYLKLNPNGVVPTLVHDGVPIIDSSVILEYLEDIFPEPSLSPVGAVEKARMRSWLRFFDEKPTPAVRYPSFQMVLIKGFQKLSPDEFEDATKRRPLKTDFYTRMGQDGFSEYEMNKAVEDIRLTVDRMETALVAGGPWLIGGQFTIADVCVAPLIDRMEDLGYEALWEENHPKVTDWLARIKERPSYGVAFYKGARFSDIYPDLKLGRSSAA
ncbi:MAG: glutathione S-transferase family protein [Proteobacteria bacterium]|nr:glutathione S-transferase family protein [Pseudomonadota bacterium]